MKNLAIIIPSLRGGGAERVVSLLSQNLSKKYNLYLIVFDTDDMVYPYGGNLIDLNIKADKSFIKKIINFCRRTYHIRKIKRAYEMETTISFLSGPNIVNILSRVNDKVIVSVRSTLSKGGKSLYTLLGGYLIKALYNKTDNIVAISNGVLNDLVNNYGLDEKKASYIYNPIDIEKVSKLAEENLMGLERFNENEFTIINVGRLSQAKGQWHLIRALTEVKKQIENVRLIILGQGELESYLKKLVEQLELQDNVVFLGYNKNPFQYFMKSDLFVFSSLYEGFGNVIIEAMACGLPVISSDCKSGPREIIAPGTDIGLETKNIEYAEYGVLIPVCDGVHHDYSVQLTNEETILAKSIIELYKNTKLRDKYSSKGKCRVKNFDIDNISKEWEKLLN